MRNKPRSRRTGAGPHPEQLVREPRDDPGALLGREWIRTWRLPPGSLEAAGERVRSEDPVFKWSAVVQLIEGASESEHLPATRNTHAGGGGLDVEAATADLYQLLD